jgi:hypothetical protein
MGGKLQELEEAEFSLYLINILGTVIRHHPFVIHYAGEILVAVRTIRARLMRDRAMHSFSMYH